MRNIIFYSILFFSLVFLYNSAFIVTEYKNALVIQLGKVVRDPITQAGLYFKIPFIQDVYYIDNRIHSWSSSDNDLNQAITTKDRKFIKVKVTAKYKVKDPLVFYKKIKNFSGANSRVGAIVDSSLKTIVAENILADSVRNTNSILEKIKKQPANYENDSIDDFKIKIEPISVGREKISDLILKTASVKLEPLGIELIKVNLINISYPEAVEKNVFKSMIAEQKQIASKIRSSGEEAKAGIYGKLDLILKKTEADAYTQIQKIKGEADAVAAETYSTIDPVEFYIFLKKLKLYKDTFKDTKSRIIVSTENEFFSTLMSGK